MKLLVFVFLWLKSCFSLTHNVNRKVQYNHGVGLKMNLIQELADQNILPVRGLIQYEGQTNELKTNNFQNSLDFISPNGLNLLKTKFNLWKQLAWKKIRGKPVLKLTISGALQLESSNNRGLLNINSAKDSDVVESLDELMTLFQFAAHDPRIQAIFINLGRLECGYAKITELSRYIKYFRQSGKDVIGYSDVAAEKELYLAQSFTSYYLPPDGGLDLRGFAGSASFLRDVFTKVGVEPQVQRIGKYKSAGDQFSRSNISEAQREVISSLLSEASENWSRMVSSCRNISIEQLVSQLWSSSGVKNTYDYKDIGVISGVCYYDQIEEYIKKKFGKSESNNFWYKLTYGNSKQQNINQTEIDNLTRFNLSEDFLIHPRRSIAAINSTTVTQNVTDIEVKDKLHDNSINLEAKKTDKKSKANSYNVPFLSSKLYLRKMRKGANLLTGLPIKQVRSGKRIAIINAVGAIVDGKSGSSPVTGKSLGSDTLISIIRRATADPSIIGVVLRVDSPGGSALGSDLIWRELRALSREKPVVASMVDVAASGGYYISMACDQIVAEDLTITGSIGVVTAKFNVEELNRRFQSRNNINWKICGGNFVKGLCYFPSLIGNGQQILSSARGFTEEEQKYFEDNAQRAYLSFITKAAASRNMSVEDMNKVAQGRVWTGRQARDRGLVDQQGGLWKSLTLVSELASEKNKNSKQKVYRIQTLSGPKPGFVASLVGGGQTIRSNLNPIAICDDALMYSNLVSDESLGSTALLRSFGIGPALSYVLRFMGTNALNFSPIPAMHSMQTYFLIMFDFLIGELFE